MSQGEKKWAPLREIDNFDIKENIFSPFPHYIVIVSFPLITFCRGYLKIIARNLPRCARVESVRSNRNVSAAVVSSNEENQIRARRIRWTCRKDGIIVRKWKADCNCDAFPFCVSTLSSAIYTFVREPLRLLATVTRTIIPRRDRVDNTRWAWKHKDVTQNIERSRVSREPRNVSSDFVSVLPERSRSRKEQDYRKQSRFRTKRPGVGVATVCTRSAAGT